MRGQGDGESGSPSFCCPVAGCAYPVADPAGRARSAGGSSATCFASSALGKEHRPELATGVLERVVRETNRRTDVEVHWSIPGTDGMLMVKLARKYHHGPWSAKPAANDSPTVRFSLVA